MENNEEIVPLECRKAMWEAKKRMFSQLIDINKKKQTSEKVEK